MKQSTLIDIARLKVDYAAESGIKKALNEMHSKNDLLILTSPVSRTYMMPDESEAETQMFPWGVYIAVVSEGRFRAFKTTRTALIADRPSSVFDNALFFGNGSHQVIFTGASSVEGTVVVGKPGVAIGNLRNFTTPVSVPISGTIEKTDNPQLPILDFPLFAEQLKCFNGGFSTNEHSIIRFNPSGSLPLSKIINDSTREVVVAGNYALNDSISRRTVPLSVYVAGNIDIQKGTKVHGLVEIIASNAISIEQGIAIDDVILSARDSIVVQKGVTISGQFIAPTINVYNGSTLKYPSFLFSTLLNNNDSIPQGIYFGANVTVEGFVALDSKQANPQSEPLIIVYPSASIIGAVYSNTKMTLDGSVKGTVLTRDFYFYEEPTKYLGWLRSGTITRSKLPQGFFIPPGFSDNVKLDVLDWL